MTAVIRFDNLTLGYDGKTVLGGLTGTIEKGGLLAVTGPNGGGKSTLMKALAGRLKPLGGTLGFDHIHRRDIAYLPQAADIDRAFPLSVFDLVSAGAWRSAGIFGTPRTAAVQAAIDAVGLKGRENAVIGRLSGGQLQRALFARLMVQDAKVILLDEPFAAVDEGTIQDLTALIRRWSGEARTILAVLHDLDLIRAHFPQTLLIGRGVVAWGPTGEALTADTLMRARRACEIAQASAAA